MSCENFTAYTISLNPNDVLLGRGVPYFTYSGNVRFRELAQERKHQYSTCGSREMKNQLAQDIITIIAERDGRFLREIIDPKEATALGISSGTSVWVHADASTIVQKVKQAMREPDTYPLQSETGNSTKKISFSPKSTDILLTKCPLTKGESNDVKQLDHLVDENRTTDCKQTKSLLFQMNHFRAEALHHVDTQSKRSHSIMTEQEQIMTEKKHIINLLLKRRQENAIRQEIALLKYQSYAPSDHYASIQDKVLGQIERETVFNFPSISKKLTKQLFYQDLERNLVKQREEEEEDGSTLRMYHHMRNY
jgi:hypothetical protein